MEREQGLSRLRIVDCGLRIRSDQRDLGKRGVERLRKLERGLESVRWILRERAGERVAERRQIAAADFGQAVGRLCADAGRPAAPQQLVHQRREAEDVGAAIPRGAGDPLGSRVRPAHRRLHADPLERVSDADAGQSCFLRRQQDVARVQRAVRDAHGGGKVERARQLGRDAHRVGGRRRTVLANREVERLGGDIILRQVRRDVDDAGADRRDKRGIVEACGNNPLELGDELVNALGRKVELEQLDRDQPFARRVVRAKHWSQRAGANLMKNTKRSERVRERSASSFRVQ